MKVKPHALNFGSIPGFKDFREPEEGYILGLGDCSMTNIYVDEVLRKSNLKCFKFRIGGGEGWEFDYENLKFCKGFILFASWANGATIVSCKKKWEERVFSQLNILRSIALQGSIVAMVDRPIVGERYIDKKLRQSISPKPLGQQLGVKKEEAFKKNWEPQSITEQNHRRDSYNKIIKEVTDLPHFHYTDLQSLLTKNQIEKYSLEAHPSNDVINEAPCHFNESFMRIVAEALLYCSIGRFDLSKKAYSKLNI